MTIGKPFQKGEGGRPKGARNKIWTAFLNDALDEWKVSGRDCLKIMAKEEPSKFVQVIAGLAPKEIEITQMPIMEIPDDELIQIRDHLRRRIEQERALLERLRSYSSLSRACCSRGVVSTCTSEPKRERCFSLRVSSLA